MLFKNRKKPKRYWDFAFINSFVELNKEHIQSLTLCLYEDDRELLPLIREGKVVKSIAGYQFMYSKVGGVMYSVTDYPCMKIRYKDGRTDRLACYKDANMLENSKVGHRSLYRS